MSLVEQIEGQIQTLSADELQEFRQWFAEYDWNVWDAQIESDAKNGRLDKLAERALADHKNGKSTRL